MQLRPLNISDREAIKELLSAVHRFTQSETDVALELVGDALGNSRSDYRFVIAEEEKNRVIGYACWGKVSVTDYTWDLYWIAVHPASQRQGVGSTLLHAVEENIMFHQGKILLIETSSTDAYRSARGFYERSGFYAEAEIRDYYRSGDNRVIYVKRLDQFH